MKDLSPTRLAAFLLACCAATPLHAAPAFPDKEIHVVIGFTPGGPTDVLGRLLFKYMSTDLGQPIVVENRPGAGGTVASQYVARSRPDGYTLLFASSSFSSSPDLYRRDDLIPARAFSMVGCAVNIPMLLLGSKNLPATTPQQLIELMRAKPNSLFMGSAGNGAIDHLIGTYLSEQLNVKFQHVPYSGNIPALTDLVAGNVQFMFSGAYSTALPYIKEQRIKALAVTSAKRSSVLPDVPTMDETILKGFDGGTWQVLVAPKGVPSDVLQRLNASLNKALKDPELLESLRQQGGEPMGGPEAQCQKYVDGEYARWSALIQKTGLKMD